MMYPFEVLCTKIKYMSRIATIWYKTPLIYHILKLFQENVNTCSIQVLLLYTKTIFLPLIWHNHRCMCTKHCTTCIYNGRVMFLDCRIIHLNYNYDYSCITGKFLFDDRGVGFISKRETRENNKGYIIGKSIDRTKCYVYLEPDRILIM